jgi:hypothetical protein
MPSLSESATALRIRMEISKLRVRGTTGENVMEYFQKFMTLAVNLDPQPAEAEQLFLFIEGFSNHLELKEKILEERPDTTVAALQIARRVAALWAATRKTEGHATFQGRRSWQQHSYGGASATQPGRSQGQQSATTSATPTAKQPSAGSASKPKKFEGNCHHCGKAGHKKSECWSLNGGKPKKQTSAALPVADMDSDAKEVVTRGMLDCR